MLCESPFGCSLAGGAAACAEVSQRTRYPVAASSARVEGSERYFLQSVAWGEKLSRIRGAHPSAALRRGPGGNGG